MNDEKEEQDTIVWKLPRSQKWSYVQAARAAGEKLIPWIEAACEARAAAGQPPAPESRDGAGDVGRT